MTLPEDIRPFDTGRNPHCRTELWKNQDDIQEELAMLDEKWYPKGTKQNIYR